MTKKIPLFIVLCLILFILLSAAITLAIRIGESSLRCSGGIVAVGDLERYVAGKCGEPLRITRPSRYGYREDGFRVWVYLFDNQYVYYLSFINERLQRIQSERCWQDNPDCQ